MKVIHLLFISTFLISCSSAPVKQVSEDATKRNLAVSKKLPSWAESSLKLSPKALRVPGKVVLNLGASPVQGFIASDKEAKTQFHIEFEKKLHLILGEEQVKIVTKYILNSELPLYIDKRFYKKASQELECYSWAAVNISTLETVFQKSLSIELDMNDQEVKDVWKNFLSKISS